MTSNEYSSPIISLNQMLTNKLELMDHQQNNKGLVGISTGFTNVDRVLGGYNKGTVTIIGARPGMGKTSFLINCMLKSNHLKPVPMLYVSFENGEDYFISRLLSLDSKIPNHNIIKGELSNEDKEDIHRSAENIKDLPISFQEDVFTAEQLIDVVTKAVIDLKVEAVYLDYLQLIRCNYPNKNRERDVNEIMRSLKELAKKLNIAIVVTSQLSRAVETRGGDKRPMLSDLRESGSIEQMADAVIFLYRPEYYGFTEWQDCRPCNGEADLIIAKNKRGPLEDIRFSFKARHLEFSEINRDEDNFFDNPFMKEDFKPF
ncbi:MAG: DnaB-like helicase C-terminal domain-containing protein [Flavobacteriales bacterium]|nr:DnaB-like helicase C-terminal domain-containing protein [Flavobacteriales bacterium]